MIGAGALHWRVFSLTLEDVSVARRNFLPDRVEKMQAAIGLTGFVCVWIAFLRMLPDKNGREHAIARGWGASLAVLFVGSLATSLALLITGVKGIVGPL